MGVYVDRTIRMSLTMTLKTLLSIKNELTSRKDDLFEKYKETNIHI